MKIVDIYGREPTDGNARRQRMESLLRAWSAPALTAAVDATPAPNIELAGDEWTNYVKILRAATVLRPRTHVAALHVYASRALLSVDELVSQRKVLVCGPRVATRWLGAPELIRLRGHAWSMLVRPLEVGVDTDTCARVLRKRFFEVESGAAAGGEHGNEAFLVSHPAADQSDALAFLLASAAGPTDRDAVGRLWELSCVVGVGAEFLALLPGPARTNLVSRLATELADARDSLDLRTDGTLELFAEGREVAWEEQPARELQLPDSRLAALLEAEAYFEHARREIGNHYYDDVASAYARIASTYDLGAMLKSLPAGRALSAASRAIVQHRPDLLATYVWHPSFAAEGACGLLQLPPQLRRPDGTTLDLSDEWNEVQRLGRELLLLQQRTEDWPSLVALGIHDQREEIAQRVQPNSRSSSYPIGSPSRTAVWSISVGDAERAETLVGFLDGYFRTRGKRGDAAIVFGLHLLPALRTAGMALAMRLAGALVAGYCASLELDAVVLSVPDALCAYGDALTELRVTLKDSVADDEWRRWLNPVDAIAYVARARADTSGGYDSKTIKPGFDAPRVLRAHAEVLAAEGVAAPAAEDTLDALLRLVEADLAIPTEVGAFSWHSLARVGAYRRVNGCEPLFVRLGRLIARSERGAERLQSFLHCKPEAHLLAYVYLGLRRAGPLSAALQPSLRTAINAVLNDASGIALGHALELANTLYMAGMGREAERCARRGLQIVERFKPHQQSPHREIALAILAGALAQQELWADVLALDVDRQGLFMFPQKQFVLNMHAVALIETKRYDEAQALLSEVLEAAEDNGVALANQVALYLRRGEPRKAIDVATRARGLLSRDDWDPILANEVVARERLGDRFTAAIIRDLLSPGARADFDDHVVTARIDPTGTSAATGPDGGAARTALTGPRLPGESDLGAGVPPAEVEPDDPVDLAIVTVLPEEYEAVLRRVMNAQAAPPGTGQYANHYGWQVGVLPRADCTGYYRVVVALAGQAGNFNALWATIRTIERWRPPYLVFSGIAGGLQKDGLKQGDVVLSQSIWYYEFGKVTEGGYIPRHRDTFRAHVGLVNSALAFEKGVQSWKDCGRLPPGEDAPPRCLCGMVGSGEKVIDDLEPEFVEAILKAGPELRAIEMEAAGACSAIEKARDEGRVVGFMMVRGISDLPKRKTPLWKSVLSTLVGSRPRERAGTHERDEWKLYASDIAAHFIASWVASPLWPGTARRFE